MRIVLICEIPNSSQEQLRELLVRVTEQELLIVLCSWLTCHFIFFFDAVVLDILSL
jgi:hypothetical protein